MAQKYKINNRWHNGWYADGIVISGSPEYSSRRYFQVGDIVEQYSMPGDNPDVPYIRIRTSSNNINPSNNQPYNSSVIAKYDLPKMYLTKMNSVQKKSSNLYNNATGNGMNGDLRRSILPSLISAGILASIGLATKRNIGTVILLGFIGLPIGYVVGNVGKWGKP